VEHTLEATEVLIVLVAAAAVRLDPHLELVVMEGVEEQEAAVESAVAPVATQTEVVAALGLVAGRMKAAAVALEQALRLTHPV
jgi:hypothetical protein